MKKIKLSVDRLEGERAVLLARGWEEEIIFPASLLPSEVKEGDILAFSIEVSEAKTEEARAKVKELLEKLSRKKS